MSTVFHAITANNNNKTKDTATEVYNMKRKQIASAIFMYIIIIICEPIRKISFKMAASVEYSLLESKAPQSGPSLGTVSFHRFQPRSRTFHRIDNIVFLSFLFCACASYLSMTFNLTIKGFRILFIKPQFSFRLFIEFFSDDVLSLCADLCIRSCMFIFLLFLHLKPFFIL